MVHEDLVTKLLTITEVSDFVGTDERIYPQEAPEGLDDSLGRILYDEIGGERTRSLDGYSGQEYVDFSLRIQSRGYTAPKTVAQAIIAALDCFQGTMGSTTVQGIFAERDADAPIVPPNDGSEQGLREVVVPLRIWFES